MRIIANSVAHFAKARLRQTLKASEVATLRIGPGLSAARHVVVFVIRNEVDRLPFFLDYYRNLGFEHFLCIDNGSTDGTNDFLMSQADVSLFSSHHSYKAARFGNDWINTVINRHCRDKWVLYVDADEFLVYPHCDAAPIASLTAHLAAAGEGSLRAMMVDMYSALPVNENVCAAGRDPLEVCGLFDPAGYATHFDGPSRTIWIKGGVRGRLYFADNIWDGPALNKVPLVYMDGQRYFLKSSHQVWPLRLNAGQNASAVRVSAALLHFKFLSSFTQKTGAAASAEHTAEYAAYQKPADPSSFVNERTIAYEGWRDFARHGLIQGDGWTDWAVSRA